jgi:hypothetical protein
MSGMGGNFKKQTFQTFFWIFGFWTFINVQNQFSAQTAGQKSVVFRFVTIMLLFPFFFRKKVLPSLFEVSEGKSRRFLSFNFVEFVEETLKIVEKKYRQR